MLRVEWRDSTQRDVVDETCFPEENCEGDDATAAHEANFGKRFGVADVHVIDTRERCRGDCFDDQRAEFCGAFFAVAKCRGGSEQRAAEHGGLCAFVRGEDTIARTERESVGFAHGRRGDDAHGEIQIADHAADDHALLKIFQSENRRRRLDDREQFQNHRADAAKMPRPRCAAQRPGHALFIHPRREIRGIHLRRAGAKNRVGPVLRAHPAIGGERARIFGKILARPELRGIHKNADDHEPARPGSPARAVDERGVPGVERTHRWHEDDRPLGGAHETADGWNAAEDFQTNARINDAVEKASRGKSDTAFPGRAVTFTGWKACATLGLRKRGRHRDGIRATDGPTFAMRNLNPPARPFMKRAFRRNRPAFTIVELMIVVSVIALVASIAMPAYSRSRKRAQATRILVDLRTLDYALDRWAIEKNKAIGDVATFSDLQPYFKPGSQLSQGSDVFGNSYGSAFSVDSQPKVPTPTYDALSDVAPASFWSPYH